MYGMRGWCRVVPRLALAVNPGPICPFPRQIFSAERSPGPPFRVLPYGNIPASCQNDLLTCSFMICSLWTIGGHSIVQLQPYPACIQTPSCRRALSVTLPSERFICWLLSYLGNAWEPCSFRHKHTDRIYFQQ